MVRSTVRIELGGRRFTQVVVKVADVGGREFPEPLAVSFLVRDKGDHHYEMSEISFTRQAGCRN